MASDDRWNDDRDRDDRYRDYSSRDEMAVAKSKVLGPAIGLIVSGVLALGMSAWGFYQLTQLNAEFQKVNKQFENDPKLNAKQKAEAQGFMQQYQQGVQTAGPVLYGINLIVGLIVIFGGVQMMSLSSRGFVMGITILSMIPCLNGCCQWMVALPFAIWGLVALSDPIVKAGFAAKDRESGGMSGTGTGRDDR